MRRPILLRLLAAGGAFVLAATSTGGVAIAVEEPPPDAVVRVEVDGLRDRSLTGTLRCERSLVADVDVRLEQTIFRGPDNRFPVTITGEGALAGVACGVEPTPFSVTLEGDGILAAGPVSYSFEVRDVGLPAWEQLVGEVTIEEETDGGIDLRVASGPLAVTLAPLAGAFPEGPRVRATVDCPEPMHLTVRVTGWQEWLPIRGEVWFPCDGPTNFGVAVSSGWGQLLPGPADVSMEIGSSPAGFDTVVHGAVELRNATPEPDFTPPPVPDPAYDYGVVRRVDGRLEVRLSIPACEVGRTFSWRLSATPLRLVLDGRWYDPVADYDSRAFEWQPCTGTEERVVVPFDRSFGDGDVILDAHMLVRPADGLPANYLRYWEKISTSPK